MNTYNMSTSNIVHVKTGKYTGEDVPLVIPFDPESDHFQNHSYQGINQEQVVLTSAPTGSGKTRIIHHAIAFYLNKGLMVAVTTPIKALSNQKYFELTQDFVGKFKEATGMEITVGLMTGDIIINPEADCIIMTTEILNESLNNFNNHNGTKKTSLKPTFIERLGCVIFDEAHYVNDEDRGKVWESILIKLSKNINTVLVSATFPNIKAYARWLTKVRKRDVCLVEEHKRIVPLKHYVFARGKLITIIEQTKFNASAYEEAYELYTKEKSERERAHKSRSNFNAVNKVINVMDHKGIFPALFFVFSKKGCEDFAQQVVQPLITHDEIKIMNKIFESKIKNHKKNCENTPQYQLIRGLLNKGICFHHAEVIPVLKEIIEILFAEKLIKVLFVTETMAAGLNMPAKTTLFASLNKMSNKGWRHLNPMEYIQMAGRAGRRGLDDEGHVIIVPVYELPETYEIRSIVDGKMDNIRSRMVIDYSLLLKMIGSGDFMSFINESLFKVELDSEISGIKMELQEERKQYSEMIEGFIPNDDFDMLYDNDTSKTEFGSTGFTLTANKKQQKKIDSIRKSIKNTPELNEMYTRYMNIKKKDSGIKVLEKNLSTTSNLIETQTYFLLDILYNMRYVDLPSSFESDENTSNPTIADYTISAKGVIAAQINECNPLILSEMMVYDKDQDTDLMLSGLTAEEIVAVLAIFIIDSNPDDRILLSDVQISSNVINRINKIKGIISRLQCIEDDFNFGNEDFWDISFNLVEALYAWASGATFNNALSLVGGEKASTGGGGFIKHVRKINNLVSDLSSLCQVCNNMKLLPELQKIEGLIIRNEVSPSSLYVE